MRSGAIISLAAAILLASAPAGAANIATEKYIIGAPAPIGEPDGAATPDGTFNLRDPDAPFHSRALADAMWLDDDGKDKDGNYLNLNHVIFTVYKPAKSNGSPDAVLVLMPGTWAGSMSMDRFARDTLRMAEEAGRRGLQVWLMDRRSEQIEDHTGLKWAKRNLDKLDIDEVLETMSEYYRPAFRPDESGVELLGRTFTPLGHQDLRFMAGWGADVAVRDWRAVVLEAHRRVGNEVIGESVESAVVKKKPGRHVFIGGHSLGGSLTVLYAAYDFDRRTDSELLGMDDVDGLVLLEGGSPRYREVEVVSADKYKRNSAKRYKPSSMAYFDFNVLGIQYAPPTMMSVGIAGFAAYNARDRETVFPDYSRPNVVRMPRVTNEALLGYAFDDDVSPMFIARASIGYPSGKYGMGGQYRRKTAVVPYDPGDCPIVTPWMPGHALMDRDYVYDWVNIDEHGIADADPHPRCKRDDPEVTDFHDFARSLVAGPLEFKNAPGRCSGPNDYPEWYFPPRLSLDSGNVGKVIVDRELGVELMASPGADRLELPTISLVGDDSAADGNQTVTTDGWAPGVRDRPETRVHVLIGYTHLDICCATRNNQEDLIDDGHEGFNASAVYAYRFMEDVIRNMR